jgi:hypothetical protein
MGLIQRFLIFNFFLFLSFPLFAVGIFDSTYSQTPESTTLKQVSSSGTYFAMFCPDAANLAETTFIENRPDTEYETFEWNGKTDISSYDGECDWAISYAKTRYWSNGNVRDVSNYNSIIISVNTLASQAPTCPPENFAQYQVLHTEGNDSYCYNEADLLTRDSCPDSTQDNSYILPSNSNNSASSMCQNKSDGSSCKYQLEDDVYFSDFENDCYSSPDIAQYDETGISQPDPTIQDCQSLGQDVTACIEDPINVCDSQGNCNSGCGSVSIGDSDPLFMCLSDDIDLDGLADYKDPDIDGDGIANELDLDADGDGLDDVKYSKPDEAMTVSVDFGALESISSQSNTKLDEIASLLETQNDSGQMPAYSTISDEITFNDSIMSRLNSSPVVLAMSSMSNAINFNTDGSCPELTFYLPSPIDQTVSTDTHCSMMPTMRLVITPVMFALYLFMGFRIFAAA